MALLLSDEKAQELIMTLKYIVKKHFIDFNKSNTGIINVKGFGDHELAIHYHVSSNILNKYSIHLMDCKTNHTLLRLNICDDNNFHKNANGERIYGNRINVFSTDEYKQKNDGQTHYKAYNLPFDTIVFHQTFSEMLDAFLEYTNTDKNGKLTISANNIQLKLF